MCPLSFGKRNVYALLDTGADVSLISAKLFNSLPKQCRSNVMPDSRVRLHSITGQPLKVQGKSKLKFKFGNRLLSFSFIVVSQMQKSMILGSDFLTAWDLKWDFQKRTLSLGSTIVSLKDKRNNESVNLVKVKQSVCIPPKATTLIPCSLAKNAVGDFIVMPLDNSRLFL